MPFDPNAYAAHKNGNPDKPAGSGLIPIGKHIVQVVDHEPGWYNSGTPYVQVTFEESGGGRKRKAKLISDGPGAPYGWWRLLEAVGWPMTDPLDENDNAAVQDAVYQRDLQIVVQDEKRDGALTGYQEVKWINPAPGGTGQPPRTARTPGERFAGSSLPESEVNPPPPGDGDIPFSCATGI